MWATGNGGMTDDDCNCDGYTTSIYTISIGAISDHGLSTYYTENCASTLAVTFSGGSHRETVENRIVSLLQEKRWPYTNEEFTQKAKAVSHWETIRAFCLATVFRRFREKLLEWCYTAVSFGTCFAMATGEVSWELIERLSWLMSPNRSETSCTNHITGGVALRKIELYFSQRLKLKSRLPRNLAWQ